MRWRRYYSERTVWIVLAAFVVAFTGSMLHWWGLNAAEVPAAAALVNRSDAPAAHALAEDVQVYFSRGGNPRGAIKTALGATHKLILIAVYEFTDFELTQALLDAQARGVKVLVYLDRGQATERLAQAHALAAAGIAVRLSNNAHPMHDKFAVLDDAVVLTGSYDWTKAANVESDENLVLIRDPEIAERYRERWIQLWEMWDREATEKVNGREEFRS